MWLCFLMLLNGYAIRLSHATHRKKQRRLIPFPHIQSNISVHNHRRLSDQQQNISIDNEGGTKQRIVILAGPHKTASSSVQNNLYNWTSTGILPNWEWPVPDEVLDLCDKAHDEAYPNKSNRRHHIAAKGFYPLIEALSPGKSNNRPLFTTYSKSEVLGFYGDAMRKAWLDGYDLIIGTEALDWVTVDAPDRDRLLRGFLDILPLKTTNNEVDGIDVWGAEESDVTIVVKFRSPRVEHLKSVWHQCCMQRMTFFEFLISLSDDERATNKLRILDSFRLAEKFLLRGFDVVLIDMSGVSRDRYDISNVVACDILGANCTKEEEIDTAENVTPGLNNVKHDEGDMGGVTDEQLQRIEIVLRNFDCNSQHVLEYEKLSILYDYEINNIMANCPGEVNSISTRPELAKRIKDIVMDRHGSGDEGYYNDTGINQT